MKFPLAEPGSVFKLQHLKQSLASNFERDCASLSQPEPEQEVPDFGRPNPEIGPYACRDISSFALVSFPAPL
jgi:hypothetical protein